MSKKLKDFLSYSLSTVLAYFLVTLFAEYTVAGFVNLKLSVPLTLVVSIIHIILFYSVNERKEER